MRDVLALTATEVARLTDNALDLAVTDEPWWADTVLDVLTDAGTLPAVVRLLAATIQQRAETLHGTRWTTWEEADRVAPRGLAPAADILAAAGRRDDTYTALLTERLCSPDRLREIADRFLDIAAGMTAAAHHQQEATTR